ncbi:hypothetical protein AGABI2DRAFT_222207 [Agaricus bisporus var. bisporus H97]|uniref:hypothetical protein n=1 Tax=Agaricus bisporus var. bisporus (strain H97 / ATCC MYA-4626 / FGSC 10389) TaxID=936046 RepID=UPI00029F7C9E|nr:hypothetical protein AGABI2DRAFT_222207 [Agaricus bisporus var. bisporus H97]EKV47780.1 hypothetical protein AGABI2DRAFT_222207 [Agaricus bisporus var. bisporus H97]
MQSSSTPYASSSTTAMPSSSAPSSPSSSISGFACPSIPHSKTQGVFDSIVKGRKSWKTLKGGEVVWPPELEAALLEGLEQYTPDDSRETRLLGRFPMRNRYISDYIYEKTGKRRTAKQVGSRLQQLRDTCGGRQLLKLLTPYRPQGRAPRPSPLSISGSLSDTDSNSDASAPPTPTEAHATLQSLLYRGVGGLGRDDEPRSIIYIDLLPNDASHGPTPMQAPPVPSKPGYTITRISQYPRHIHEIDPTVTLASRSSIIAKSHFTVHSRAGIVHSEVTEMTPANPNSEGAEGEFLYSTKLAPAFWNELCRNQDPTQYTIIQKVTQEPHNSFAAPIFHTAYKFTFPLPNGNGAVAQTLDTFPLGEPTIRGSPALDFELSELFTLDPDAFSDFGFVSDDKSADLYGLEACLNADWRIYSPATSVSSEGFSDCQILPSSADIPLMAL